MITNKISNHLKNIMKIYKKNKCTNANNTSYRFGTYVCDIKRMTGSPIETLFNKC